MKPRIIFSNYDDLKNPYYGGGGAVVIHEVAKRLVGEFDVTVLTAAYPQSKNEDVDGVKYKRGGPIWAGPRLGQLAFQLMLPLQIRQNPFDLWVESSTPPFSSTGLQRFTKKPVVIFIHMLTGAVMTKKYHLPFEIFERGFLKSYRKGIALTEAIKEKMLQFNSRMLIKVIPNGIDESTIENAVHSSDEHILFLGRIDTQQKGLDILLDAYRSVAGKISLPLVVCGSGVREEEQALTERIRCLALGDKIRWLGKTTGGTKAEVLRRAAFFVMPSRYEGFPLSALDAFCYQLPVVAFGIRCLEFLPEECCLKVEPFSASAFGQAMLRLSSDHHLRCSMGAKAKEFVRGYGWDKVAAMHCGFLKQLLMFPNS